MQQIAVSITLSCMSKHLEKIDARIREIDTALAELRAEKTALRNLRAKYWYEQALRPGEQVTKKNARKLELFAKISGHLLHLRDNHGRRKGASTRDLFDHVTKMYNEQINYNTFRSYLTRFKNEGRLEFDHRTESWLIATDQKEIL